MIKSISKVLLLLVVFTAGCKKDDELKTDEQLNNNSNNETQDPSSSGPSTIVVRFTNHANGHDVDQTGGTMYVNNAAQQFNVLQVKYYISNVVLVDQNGSEYKVPDLYHLIDESDVIATGFVHLNNIPQGNYIGMRFMVGVDSARAAGAQTGDLDPSKGMYISPSSGYISFLMEGNTNVAAAPSYDFHVCGYATGMSSLRTISLGFNGTTVVVDGAHKPAKPHIYADLQEVFKTPTTINFTTTNSITSPGAAAMGMADNYADMFRVDHFD